jgi:hypothetical protein
MCDIKSKIKMARESIVLIDSYIDEITLSLLEHKHEDVSVTVCSRNQMSVGERNVKRRKGFRSGFSFIETNLFQNMYMMIDNKFLYMLSRSLRFNNKRSFWYIQIMDINEIRRVRQLIMESQMKIRKQYRHF